MKLTLFIAIIIVLRYLVPRLVDFGASEKTERKSEWHYRVKFAKLNKEKFKDASPEEKEELLYYFTQKLRLADNYSEMSLRNMPKVLQIVYLINDLEMEVNNGGYLQFFTNSTGRFVDETLEALELIGATHNHQLLTKAVETLLKHNENTKDLNERINSKTLHELIDLSDFYGNTELQDKLNELDKAFYLYKEQLSQLKMDYFENNAHALWPELEEKYPN